MKVRANPEICVSAGQCALRLPEVFDQDPYDGTVIVLREEPTPAHHAAVIEAVRLCPSGAITTD